MEIDSQLSSTDVAKSLHMPMMNAMIIWGF